MKNDISRRGALRMLMGVTLLPTTLLLPITARAHGGVAQASAGSSLLLSLPVAALSVAPVMILSAGVMLTVVAVEITATGTVWLLRRASDGVTASLSLTGNAIGGSAVGVGTAILVTAVAAGWLLSAAGEVICLVPNAVGEALLYSERIR